MTVVFQKLYTIRCNCTTRKKNKNIKVKFFCVKLEHFWNVSKNMIPLIQGLQTTGLNDIIKNFHHDTLIECLPNDTMIATNLNLLLDQLWSQRNQKFKSGCSPETKDQLKLWIKTLQRHLKCITTQIGPTYTNTIRPKPQLINQKIGVLSKYFSLHRNANFFKSQTDTSSSSSAPASDPSNKRTPFTGIGDANGRCLVTQFHRWDNGEPIATPDSFENSSIFTYTEYISESKQLHAMVDRLLQERDKDEPRSKTLVVQDFYAFVRPFYDSVAALHEVIFPNENEEMFNGKDLFTFLKSNAAKTKAAAAIAAAAAETETEEALIPEIEVELEPPVPMDTLPPTLTNILVTAVSSTQPLVDALAAILLSEECSIYTHRVTTQSHTLQIAAIRSKMDGVRDILEGILVSNGCSAGMSHADFHTKIHAPIQLIMEKLGQTLFRGYKNYLATTHPEYIKVHDECTSIHGGLSECEGVHVNLEDLVQSAVDESGTYVVRKYFARGGTEKTIVIKMECDAAWKGHSTNQLHQYQANGKQQHTIGSIAVAGNGAMSMHGRGLHNLFMYMGNDKRPALGRHLQPHYETIQKYNAQELQVNVNVPDAIGDGTHVELWNVYFTIPVDMSAAWSIKNCPLTKQKEKNCFLSWNHFPNWVYKMQFHHGSFTTALPITFFEDVLKPLFDQLDDDEKEVIMGDWGVKYDWCSFPINTLCKVYQARFHACATVTKYVFGILFRVGHALKTADALTKTVLDTIGYLLSFKVHSLRGKDQILMTGGLTTGAYPAALATVYKEIAFALIPDHLVSDASTVQRCRDQLTCMLRTISRNNTFVLSPHVNEWESWKDSAKMYTALEDRWQSKYCLFFGNFRLTMSMRSRLWDLLEQMSIGSDRFKLNPTEFLNEADGEERHKLYHYIRKRIRFVGSELSTDELTNIMAHMHLEDFLRIDAAGGIDNYRNKNACTHAKSIIKRWRQEKGGVSFEQRMYDEDKLHFERVCEKNPSSGLIIGDLEWLRNPSQEVDLSYIGEEEMEIDEPEENIEPGEGEDGDEGDVPNEDPVIDDIPDGQVLEDEEIVRQMNLANQMQGISVVQTSGGYNSHASFICRGGSQLSSKRKECEFKILRGKDLLKIIIIRNKKQIRIDFNSIESMYIELPKEDSSDEDSSEEEESEEEAGDGSSSSSEESCEEEQEEEQEQDEDETSTSSTSTSSTSSTSTSATSSNAEGNKRKRFPTKKGATYKKETAAKKQKVQNFKKDERCRITLDLLSPAVIEAGVPRTRLRGEGGNATTAIDFQPIGGSQNGGRRIVLTMHTNRQPKTVTNVIDELKNIARTVGNEDWNIKIVFDSPPHSIPDVNDDAWAQRKEDSKINYGGMPFLVAAAILDDTDRNAALERILDACDKKDVDLYRYAQGKEELLANATISMECPSCGVKIVCPNWQRCGTCLPKWSTESTGQGSSYVKGTSHMRCTKGAHMSARSKQLFAAQISGSSSSSGSGSSSNSDTEIDEEEESEEEESEEED